MNRTALITGASRGIGRAIAEELAAGGYRLVICGRDEGRLAAARDDLSAAGAAVDMCVGDVADQATIALILDEVAGDSLHVLVLAAGVGFAAPFDREVDRRWDTQFAVNVRAPFQLMRALLPALRDGAAEAPDTGAKVIAISSLTGVAAEPGLTAYGASKSALISLCESLTVAEAATGVSATAISPGYVDTDMSSWKRDEIPAEDMIRTADVATMVTAVCRLSRHVTIPNIVMSRPGSQLWRA